MAILHTRGKDRTKERSGCKRHHHDILIFFLLFSRFLVQDIHVWLLCMGLAGILIVCMGYWQHMVVFPHPTENYFCWWYIKTWYIKTKIVWWYIKIKTNTGWWRHKETNIGSIAANMWLSHVFTYILGENRLFLLYVQDKRYWWYAYEQHFDCLMFLLSDKTTCFITRKDIMHEQRVIIGCFRSPEKIPLF